MKIKPSSSAPKRYNKAHDNGQYLFKATRATWPETAEKTKIKLGTDGTSFSDYFNTLEGTEHPELFLLWLQEFQTKVEHNSRVAQADKLDVLCRTVKGEAKAVVLRTIASTTGNLQLTHVNNADFTNQLILRRLHLLSTRAQWAVYLDSDQHSMDVITECIHALKLLIFGSDMAGKKSYIGLKRQMRNFNVDFNHGIKQWAARIDDYQSYLPHMLWEAGAEDGESPTKFDEQDLQELLEGCLNK